MHVLGSQAKRLGSLSAGKSSGSGVYIVYENGRKLDRRGDDSTSHRALGGRFPLVRLETFEYGIWTVDRLLVLRFSRMV